MKLPHRGAIDSLPRVGDSDRPRQRIPRRGQPDDRTLGGLQGGNDLRLGTNVFLRMNLAALWLVPTSLVRL